MTAFIALLLTMFTAGTSVTGLSVVPVADRTEVVILVDGNVSPNHFMMPDGRLVVDLRGVPQAPRLDLRNFNRGGIRELRVGPFQPTVTRVVLGLGSPVEYEFTRDGSRIRISFANRGGSFEAWSHNAPMSSAPVPAASTAVRPPQQTEPVRSQRPIDQQDRDRRIRSISFNNEPVNIVLGVFSDMAGQNIVAAPAVQGRTITATLTDVTWREALEAILEANNMMLRAMPSGVLLVQDRTGAGADVASEPLVTRSFPVQYISADSISRAVTGLLSTAGKVTVNSASNTLLITDTRSSMERLEGILPDLDVRTPQVDITAVIAFIDRTTLEAFGVTYDLKDSRGNQLNRLVTGIIDGQEVSNDVVLLGGNSVAALGNANYRVASPALEVVTSLVLGRHTLISFIEALQTVSLSDVQAKPVVRTMDHRLATIQVGEQTPVRVIDAGAAGGTGSPRATVEYKNTGIILEVTPHITGNQVLLDMRAERSGIAAAPSDIGVIFQTQNAQTQVLVNDGETVVIGGLTITEKTRSRAGIPILMDLPVIGALFRNQSEQENKRDLLIMVTPHIVRD